MVKWKHLLPRGGKPFINVTPGEVSGAPFTPERGRSRKVQNSTIFAISRNFRAFYRNSRFCENVALAAGRPSKTTNKRQLILGFERRERRGRRFRVKSGKQETFMKSRKFDEIPGFRAISVIPRRRGRRKAGKGGPPGGPRSY